MGNQQEKKKEEKQQDPIEKVEDKPVKQSKERTATEKDMENVTTSTKQELDKQKKVKVKLHLPQDQLNRLKAAEENKKHVEWPYQVVSINGYTYQIQLGKSVEVPKAVADVLEQAGLI